LMFWNIFPLPLQPLLLFYFSSPLGHTLEHRADFCFIIILQTVGVLGRVVRSSQGLYLNTGQHKHRKNTYAYQTPMPWVGFEPMIPVSERAKAVHSLDCSATVADLLYYEYISQKVLHHARVQVFVALYL
jgi:hypothetical protein